jgi:hypothetical protein
MGAEISMNTAIPAKAGFHPGLTKFRDPTPGLMLAGIDR